MTEFDSFLVGDWLSLFVCPHFSSTFSFLISKVNCHLKECDSKRKRGVMRLPSSGSRSNTPSRRESDFDDYDAKVFMPVTKCEKRWATLCHQWATPCHQ